MTEDPRLASRRAQVQEAVRSRRRRIALAVIAVIAVVAGCILITRSPLLDVDRVAVTGASNVPARRIVAASGLAPGDVLVDLDAAGARRRVMAVPGIASARVTVEWPDTVRIRVTEDRRLVRVMVGESAVEIARGGRVLGPVTPADGEDLPALPVLRADSVVLDSLRPGRPVPSELSDAMVVFEQMPTSVAPRLAAATLAADGSLEFALPDDGGTVRFGTPDEIPAKLLAAATMLGGGVVTDCLDVLDIREPTRPTMSRKQGCQLAPPTVGATTTTVPKGSKKATTTVPPTTAAKGGR